MKPQDVYATIALIFSLAGLAVTMFNAGVFQ